MLVAAIYRGQFLLAVIALVVTTIVLKLSAQELIVLIVRVLDSLERGYVLGYLAAAVLAVSCFLRTRTRRPSHRESQRRLLEALDRIDIAALIEVERELQRNLRVRGQVEARSASFERCELEILHSFRARTLRIALEAVAINNGGLIFSILPAMPFLLASPKFRKWVLRLTVQAIDLHQQLGPAYVRVEHDVLRL